MKNNIDQFFKDKLEGHSLPPSEEAWVKVEANLSKKNNVAIWRIAAAILITGALVSVIIWSQRDNKNKEQILATKKSPLPLPWSVSPQTENKRDQKESNETKTWSVKTQTMVEENKTNSNSTKSATSLTSKKPSISKSELPRFVSPQTESKSDQKESNETKTRPVKTQTTAVEPSFATAFVETSAVKKVSEDKEKINTKATPPTTIASTRKKSIKLEFTLEDFSTEQPVATVNEEKNSGLKKVWEMAREVKNGDGPVREIKNELFALSFKKNKNQ